VGQGAGAGAPSFAHALPPPLRWSTRCTMRFDLQAAPALGGVIGVVEHAHVARPRGDDAGVADEQRVPLARLADVEERARVVIALDARPVAAVLFLGGRGGGGLGPVKIKAGLGGQGSSMQGGKAAAWRASSCASTPARPRPAPRTWLIASPGRMRRPSSGAPAGAPGRPAGGSSGAKSPPV
jgi:hypothetical protein